VLIVATDGVEPILFANTATEGVVPYLRRDYPGAVIYACASSGAYRQASEHLAAYEVIYHDEAQTDADGNPVTVSVGERVLVGNSVAVDPDGPTLRLLDADGQCVGSLPLTVAP